MWKYTKRFKSISAFLEKAKSYDNIIEFLHDLKNQYANIAKLQFLVKNSSEIKKWLKPDHLEVFPSLVTLCNNHLTLQCKRKIDSKLLRKRILMIWILTVLDSTNAHSFLLGFSQVNSAQKKNSENSIQINIFLNFFWMMKF